MTSQLSTHTTSVSAIQPNTDITNPPPTDGFETPTSDVDILLLLTPAAFAPRRASGKLTSASHDLATYPGGYVDAKYVSVDLIRDAAARGSEAARFALEGVTVLFERDGSGVDVRAEVERAVRYPVEGKAERMRRFRAQLDAWRWFWREGRRKGDGYLVGLAVRKLVLFGGRLVLAENEVLYPFHKWFLRVLGSVTEKPEGLMEAIARVLEDPSEENVEGFYEMVKGFRGWEENPNGWGAQFMLDSELTWMTGTRRWMICEGVIRHTR